LAVLLSVPRRFTVDQLDVLPFAASASEVPGQLSFIERHVRPDRAPLPPAAAFLLGGRDPRTPEWSAPMASRCFRLLMTRNHYDEEAAYTDLLDSGCPLEMADAAWNAWAQQVRA
jgi:hypothetical protein